MVRPTRTARRLRKAQTDAEQLLWSKLRNRRFSGLKFRRQAPVGRFIADFLSEEAMLIIEVDGGQHASSSSDQSRTAFLESAGYVVLRFWNHDVLQNIDGVLTEIGRTIGREQL